MEFEIDEITKEEIENMSPSEINFWFEKLAYKDVTEQKKVKLLGYLDIREAENSGIVN